MIDIHSHILPRIDDGSDSMSESLEILRGLAGQGITDVIATPHFVNGSTYMSPATTNRQLLKALQQQLKDNKIKIRIHLGNELYIDSELSDLLALRRVNTMADSRFVLVELPISGEFPDFQDVLVSLTYQGYKVILAHPERYHTFQKDFSLVEELAGHGIMFQCNLGSIIGQYGKSAKKMVKKMVKRHYVYAFGTDIHRKRDYDEIAKAQKKLSRWCKKDEFDKMLVKNPSAIIREGLLLNRKTETVSKPVKRVAKSAAKSTAKPATKTTRRKVAAK